MTISDIFCRILSWIFRQCCLLKMLETKSYDCLAKCAQNATKYSVHSYYTLVTQNYLVHRPESESIIIDLSLELRKSLSHVLSDIQWHHAGTILHKLLSVYLPQALVCVCVLTLTI